LYQHLFWFFGRLAVI